MALPVRCRNRVREDQAYRRLVYEDSIARLREVEQHHSRSRATKLGLGELHLDVLKRMPREQAQPSRARCQSR
jgi:hypothetical protein